MLEMRVWRDAYCVVRPGALLVQEPNENFQSIRILEHFKQCGIHRKVFDSFQHIHKVLRLQELTSSKQT